MAEYHLRYSLFAIPCSLFNIWEVTSTNQKGYYNPSTLFSFPYPPRLTGTLAPVRRTAT